MLEPQWRHGSRVRRPFCAAAGVQPRGVSRRAQRALTDFGADAPFATAAAKFTEHYGVAVPRERVRRVCLRHAHRLAQAAPAPVRTLPPGGPAWIVAEADGTMLPVVATAHAPAGADRRRHRQVRWQETRLLAARALGQVRTHYEATLHDVTEAGARWSAAAGRAGWGTATRIHAVGDGAPWLAAQCRAQFGARGRYLLDLYHVCDYLAAALGPDAPPGTLAQHRDRLLRGDHTALQAEWAARVEPPAVPDEAAPVRSLHRYLANRPEQLDYPGAVAAGLPVGSGLIESGHRHVLQARLKRAGAWWTEANLHAMAQLRVCRANAAWAAAWQN